MEGLTGPDFEKRLRAGDQTVLTDLLVAHGIRAENHVRRKVPSVLRVAQLDDVLQEAIVKVWHKRWSYESTKGNPKDWFLKIVERTAIDILRRHGENIELVTPDPDGLIRTPGWPGGEGEEDLLEARKTHPLRILLATQFSEREGRVIEAYMFALPAKPNCRELAEELGVSEGNVRQIWHRAKRRMELFLSQDGSEAA